MARNETIRMIATHFNVFEPTEERPHYTLQFYDKKSKVNVLVNIPDIAKLSDYIVKSRMSESVDNQEVRRSE